MELVFGTYPSWSLLIVRVVLGAIFFAHGAQKFFGWFGGMGLRETIRSFQQVLRIPPALAVPVAITETVGGLAMIGGVLVRVVAVMFIIHMLVAIAKVTGQHGFFLAQRPGGNNGCEYNLVLIGMALAILVGGAGALSIDRLILPR